MGGAESQLQETRNGGQNNALKKRLESRDRVADSNAHGPGSRKCVHKQLATLLVDCHRDGRFSLANAHLHAASKGPTGSGVRCRHGTCRRYLTSLEHGGGAYFDARVSTGDLC